MVNLLSGAFEVFRKGLGFNALPINIPDLEQNPTLLSDHIYSQYIKHIEKHKQSNNKGDNHWLGNFFEQINQYPPNILNQAYLAEQSGGTLRFLAHAARGLYEKSDTTSEVALKYLARLAGKTDCTDLLNIESKDPFLQELSRNLLTTESLNKLFLYENNSKEAIKLTKNDRKLKQLSEEFRQKELWRRFMRKVLMKTTNINEVELADSYVYAASFYKTDQATILLDLIKKISSIGPENLSLLRDFSGIYALSSYSTEQLENILRLARGESREIARLQQCDSQVVFLNSMGDHNAALANVPEKYDDSHNRTIFFETQSWGDVYRHISKLNKMGIKPAKVIFAQHGSSGYAPIVRKPPVNEVDYYYQSATLNSEANDGHNTNYHIKNIVGFSRIINDYMQVSHNINDPESIKGEKLVIFHSCNQATEIELNSAENSQSESVISRIAYELSKKVTEPLIIFGSPDAAAWIRTNHGFKLEIINKNQTTTPANFIAYWVTPSQITYRTKPRELKITKTN